MPERPGSPKLPARNAPRRFSIGSERFSFSVRAVPIRWWERQGCPANLKRCSAVFATMPCGLSFFRPQQLCRLVNACGDFEADKFAQHCIVAV